MSAFAGAGACCQSCADAHSWPRLSRSGGAGSGVARPNPAVGALIVKDGVIVARGWTRRRAAARMRKPRLCARRAAQPHGATLYATWNPAAIMGKRRPVHGCDYRGAGMAAWSMALDDPDPRVSGRGHRKCCAMPALTVTTGVLAEAALRGQSRPYSCA